MSLARVMASANQKARELSVDVDEALIDIHRCDVEGRTVWRISYGPKDYINRRGGDVVIEVDTRDPTVQRVLQGQ